MVKRNMVAPPTLTVVPMASELRPRPPCASGVAAKMGSNSSVEKVGFRVFGF
jgi:hypothetical protein